MSDHDTTPTNPPFVCTHLPNFVELRGGDYFWIGYRNVRSKPADGTDLRAFYDGKISVTPLHIDLTHMPTVHELKAVLGGPPPRQ